MTIANFDLKEWKDTQQARSLGIYFGIGFFFLSIFFALTFQVSGNLIYYLGGIGALISIITAFENPKQTITKFWAANMFGNRTKAVLGLFLGAGMGLVFASGASSVKSILLPFQAIYIGDLNFALAVIVAPVLEPIFWRGIIVPTLNNALQRTFGEKFIIRVIGVALSAAIFLFFHFGAYSTNYGNFVDTLTNLFWIGILFAIIFTLGCNWLQTITFEIGWHLVNNIYAYGLVGIEAIATVLVFVAVLTGIFLISLRNEKEARA